MKKKKITIIVEGGIVQEILNIPDDIIILINDYDCDTEPNPNDPYNSTKIDSNGDYFWLGRWSN